MKYRYVKFIRHVILVHCNPVGHEYDCIRKYKKDKLGNIVIRKGKCYFSGYEYLEESNLNEIQDIAAFMEELENLELGINEKIKSGKSG